MITSDYFLFIKLELNKSLSEIDRPKTATIYLTSNDGWKGVSGQQWLRYYPSNFKIEFEKKKSEKGLTFVISSDKLKSKSFSLPLDEPEEDISKWRIFIDCPERSRYEARIGL